MLDLTVFDQPYCTEFIENALKEDVGEGDHSSLACISEDHVATAELLFKSDGIAAGLRLAEKILLYNDTNCKIEMYKKDGDFILKGTKGFQVIGNARQLLKSERLLLNALQRLSGIATTTHKLTRLIEGTKAKLLDTRKTTPGIRFLEKWAVRAGGGLNHRHGLYDMILLKDNHIDVCGSIKEAILHTRNYLNKNSLNLPVEIETRNLEEVGQAIETGNINRIMFDNFSVEDTFKAVQMVNDKYETESSGGINPSNLRAYAETGVDFISLGLLTHTVQPLDMSFKIKLS